MDFDVTVLGAGPAGMIAMLRFAASGFSVLGIEKVAPFENQSLDLRSTAFLMPAINTLINSGVWEDLKPNSVALDVMEIVGIDGDAQKTVKFDASEIGNAHFGFNISNIDLLNTLREKIKRNPNISISYDDELANFKQFTDHVEMRFNNHEPVTTRLLIGAEGRNSPLRDKLQISTTRHEYDQWAQVFTVSHDVPHAHISTEVHEIGGPFTTVPSMDINGRHSSAIVWMDTAQHVEAYKKLSKTEFEIAMNKRSHNVRGMLTLESEIARFPMISMEAQKLHEHRAVLIGESAHVVPPIGAQGLNMSLKDIETLTRAMETGALQTPAQLNTWARARKADIAIRRRGIDALNRISIAGFNRATTLRNLGLWALEKDTPLKTALMKLGLGD